MNKHARRLIMFLMMLASAFGTYLPGRAASQTALTAGGIINIAHFFKPPSMDAATAVKNFNTVVLTNGDHVYRNELQAAGFASDIPQYFRSEAVYDPGSCTASTLNNTVAYNSGDFCWISQNHPDWFLLDGYGKRITVTSGGKYYRMDPGNAGWRDFFLLRVIQSEQQYGWTALFLDNVEGGLGKFYDTKPAKYSDNASYQNAVSGFLQYLYVNYAQKYGRPIYGNIVARADDTVWFHYLQYLHGAMQERFAVGWNETSYVSANQWLEDMSMMEQAQANGKFIILVAPGNQSDINRETFAFASYLLISNGKAAFRYSTDDEYRNVWLYDNYKVNLGSPVGPRYPSGGVWRRDFTNGYVIVDPVGHGSWISVNTKTTSNVFIGGTFIRSYDMPIHTSTRDRYAGVNNGPLKVTSENGLPVIASERVAYTPDGGNTWTSFDETIGLPENQLSTSYYFPYYNNVEMNMQLRFGNVGNVTTNVTVSVAGTVQGTYTLYPSQSIRVSYPLNNGPVKVQSTGGIPIVASMRFVRIQSVSPLDVPAFTEIMGLPAEQLADTYVFPYYNNLEMDSQLRFANVGTNTTNVTVTIGGVVQGTYLVAPNQSMRVSYPVNNGPVQVKSTNSVPILASMRFVRIKSQNPLKVDYFSETMGLAMKSVSTNYWFPIYDNVTHDMQLRFGNLGTSLTNVTVTIAGAVQGTYQLYPNQTIRIAYNANKGPVHVQSSGGVPIIASMRFVYIESRSPLIVSAFSEMVGLPAEHLSASYVFPWYNNVEMDTQFRLAVP